MRCLPDATSLADRSGLFGWTFRDISMAADARIVRFMIVGTEKLHAMRGDDRQTPIVRPSGAIEAGPERSKPGRGPSRAGDPGCVRRRRAGRRGRIRW